MAVKKPTLKDYEESKQTKSYANDMDKVESQKPSSFQYKDYSESDRVKDLWDTYNSTKKPGAFTSQWEQSLNDTINKIQNREKFTYDLNGDALYQQYKDRYIQQGQMAMMDTIGQAAALTGGYGNSYATTAGSQAYQGYLQGLNDKVPELYQLALDQYNREGDDLYNQYSLLSDRYNQDYGMHRDAVSDYYNDKSMAYDVYSNEADKDYTRYADDKSFSYGEHRDNVSDWNAALDRANSNYWQSKGYDYDITTAENTNAWNQYQSDVSQHQWQQNYDEDVRQYNQNYTYQQQRDQKSDAQWQAEFDEARRQYNASLAEQQRQYNATMAYNKSKSSTTTTNKSNTNYTVDYSDWDGGDWESYFASIRQSEGQAAAEKELKELTHSGDIPSKYVALAASGARGGKMGH